MNHKFHKLAPCPTDYMMGNYSDPDNITPIGRPFSLCPCTESVLGGNSR